MGMTMDPNKRGNPPFEPSSYAAGLERRVERLAAWNKVAKEMARDMLEGDEIDRAVAAGWWRQQLDLPQVVMSADDMRAMVSRVEAAR